jgi:hypothetical protein
MREEKAKHEQPEEKFGVVADCHHDLEFGDGAIYPNNTSESAGCNTAGVNS